MVSKCRDRLVFGINIKRGLDAPGGNVEWNVFRAGSSRRLVWLSVGFGGPPGDWKHFLCPLQPGTRQKQERFWCSLAEGRRRIIVRVGLFDTFFVSFFFPCRFCCFFSLIIVAPGVSGEAEGCVRQPR